MLYYAGERTSIVTQSDYDNLSPSNRVRKDMDARAISRLSDLHFPSKLTKRESEILPLLLAGSTRVEIAYSLSVSPETVKLHTRNILSKFGATTVRDGFYDMNLYQTHYGVGGQGSDRFENLFQCVCQILPGQKDVRITNQLNITAMQDELSEFKFSYDALSGTHVIENYPVGVDTNGPRLSIIDTSPRVPMSLRVKWEWNEV